MCEGRSANGAGARERYFCVRSDAAVMLCYYCGKDAQAICRFCGAALCKTDVRAARFVSGWASRSEFGSGAADYIVVNNAIWCGRCSVQTAYGTR